MIERTAFDNQDISPRNSDTFLPFTRPHVAHDTGDAENDLSDDALSYESGYICTVTLADELIEKLRKAGEETEVQHHDNVQLTPKLESKPATQPAPVSSAPTTPPTGTSGPTPTKKNKNDANDHQMLVNRLNKKPHIIEFKGVELDRNERLKIIAAVAMCESGADPFGAMSEDQEFVGRKNGNHGAETSYSRIVHIGLSYGVIQFTQDSGSLGGVLKKCNEKNHAKFVETFGDNFQQLLTLTNAGIDVPGVNYTSGLDHWHSISKTKEGLDISAKASAHDLPVNMEIRGRRVQPIAVTIGGQRQDIWKGTWKQRFKNAAQVADFQEAQLIFAVEHYLNPTLTYCKDNNVRSALGIAFAVACQVRGVNSCLLSEAAKTKGLKVPFESEADEKAAVTAISKGEIKNYSVIHKGVTKTVGVNGEEIKRAGYLIKDETGFLAEDLYWVDSYNKTYDH